MACFFRILLLLGCAVITASSGTPDRVRFSISQILTSGRPRSIALDKQKVAYRYGNFTENARNYQSCYDCGDVSAYPVQFDSSYVCPVKVGGQTVYLDFDTGSSDLWVMSSLLPKDQIGNHSVYNPALSDSSRLLNGSTWNVTYGDNTSASGIVYQDDVDVGGAVVSAQAIQVANMVSKAWTDSPYRDGILGLAGDSLNTVQPQKQKTFFTHLARVLHSKVFTAYLQKGKPGSFDFGYIDNTKHYGSISYLPVKANSGLWEFSAGGYAIGNGSVVSGTLGTTFADTGASLTYLPKTLIDAYYDQVQNASYDESLAGYIFPCSASLPNLTLQIGNNHITIHGLLINYAPIITGSKTCLGGIQESPAPGISIFGDTFFTASFVVFDRNNEQNPRIGFAQQR